MTSEGRRDFNSRLLCNPVSHWGEVSSTAFTFERQRRESRARSGLDQRVAVGGGAVGGDEFEGVFHDVQRLVDVGVSDIAAVPAVLNGVFNATGVRICHLPATRSKLLEALG